MGDDKGASARVWRLDARRAACFSAERLLLARPGEPVLEADFMRDWRHALPPCAQPRPEHFAGRPWSVRSRCPASPSRAARSSTYFSAKGLPAEPGACFARLFAFLDHWRLQDMDPYLEHLLGPNVRKADLLKRFMRLVDFSLNSEERVLVAR